MQIAGTCLWGRAFAFVELTSEVGPGGGKHLPSKAPRVSHFKSRFHPQVVLGLSGHHTDLESPGL